MSDTATPKKSRFAWLKTAVKTVVAIATGYGIYKFIKFLGADDCGPSYSERVDRFYDAYDDEIARLDPYRMNPEEIVVQREKIEDSFFPRRKE